MRYLIFSDIHGNLESLEALIAASKIDCIDKFICVGDVVGYGPDPHQCLEIVENLNCTLIAGNHDWGVAGLFDLSFFNVYAKEALLWSKRVINKQDKKVLQNMKLDYQEENFCCVHGSYLSPEKFPYIYSEDEALKMFAVMPKNLCFIGHTHVPMIFTSGLRGISVLKTAKTVINPRSRYICNVGSVGQPRDGIPKASYAIYDAKKKLVEIKRISYNISKVQNKIRKAGLAEFLAARLGQGR